jgi:hypothetical protein
VRTASRRVVRLPVVDQIVNEWTPTCLAQPSSESKRRDSAAAQPPTAAPPMVTPDLGPWSPAAVTRRALADLQAIAQTMHERQRDINEGQ